METREANLEPCPFCGGAAELKHSSTWDYFVRCTECGARTRQYHENDVGAANAWNHRVEIQWAELSGEVVYLIVDEEKLPSVVRLVTEDGAMMLYLPFTPWEGAVVRCRDCKGYRPGEPCGWCNTHMTAIPREDGFCAWGVPADSDEELSNRGLNDGRSDD